MRSRSFHYRHHSFIPTARHRTYQSNANRSHYDANRLTVNRNSQKPSNFNEQTWYHSTSDNKRHYSGKWDGPPSKRSCFPPVSYYTLTKLIDKSSDEILNEMLHRNFQLRKFLNDKRMQDRYDWLYSMTVLLEKITKCIGSNERIRTIIEQLPNTSYLEGVYNEVPKVDPATNQLRFHFIQLFLKIANTFLDMIPDTRDTLMKIIERIELKFSKTKSESLEFQMVKNLLDQVLEEIKRIEQRQQPKQGFQTMTPIQNNISQSFNDYRQLSIVPDLAEILCCERPYLRKNITDGIYEDAEQYLDIHFRLLREDFVGPLRDGTQQYLSKVPGKNCDIRIYENVHVHNSRITPHSGVVYDLLLDSGMVSKIYWANSRRLIYGNLLILTFNNFQSYAYFTVEDRSKIEREFIISVKKLNESHVFEDNKLNIEEIDSSCKLTMIETMIYFEAYHPVLKALQKIPSDHRFPLGQFLLKLTNERIAPDYVKPATTYDFTPLLVNLNPGVRSRLIVHTKFSVADDGSRNQTEISETNDLQINHKQTNQFDEKYKRVCILNKDEWPTSEELHLNPKQHEALMLALTNKVALIQGPPGTGKTFLGVRITEMLLYNRSVWCSSNEQSTPILIICHTNHALDQFLELIVKRLNMRQGIIRVGSRCENKTIQQFSLVNARRRARENRSIPLNIYRERYELLAEKNQIEADLKSYYKSIEISKTHMIPLSTFTWNGIIDYRHYESLLAPFNKTEVTEETVLFTWLYLLDKIDQRCADEIFNKTSTTNVTRMEVNNDIEEISEDKLNTEEKEEEERRRNELDMEENDDIPSLDAHQSTIDNKLNYIDTETFSEHNVANTRQSQAVGKTSNSILRFMKYIELHHSTFDDERVQQINDNVWQLSENDRYNLYGYWLKKYRQHLRSFIDPTIRKYHETLSRLNEYREDVDYYILKDSIIIAMTTTCAAKYHNALEKLQSKIVIVEEAAAIFEAHIITALSTKCEHLILIGDHVQLRPTPGVYQLGKKYNIDVSLFERLIKNNFPNVRLNIQHRMRPEISRLMKYFYNDLEDHISVKTDRAPIRGVEKSVFFINHNHNETNVDDGRSKRNEFEAKYAIELAQYLVKQDYSPKQITILVMYLGQKQFIAREVKQVAPLHGVRIMITDNYQGEENDIIIISLVRSNLEKSIGFLSIENRVCVALSRARCGLFVIGNMTLLAEVNDMWKNIFTSLSETKEIGPGLSLCCHQHPESNFIAKKPECFALRTDGGCTEQCDARLKCGHRCQLRCHNNDFEHDVIKCYKRCGEKLSCGHSCTRRCHYEIPNEHDQCYVFVEKTIIECGHQITVECFKTPTSNMCKELISKQLSCHHDVGIQCRIASSPDELKRYSCPKRCDAILACQHKCVGTCGECRTGKLHVACGEKCERELICSHVCKVSCANNCPPCSRDCQTRCIHSRCRKQCGDLCKPCIEPCAYKCKHLRCTRLCHEPCDRGPCNMPCDKKLKCGHMCIGLCGELCPKECHICHKNIVQDIFFGSEDEPDAHFVLLPDCKHIFEVNALDKFIENFINNADDKAAIRFPECPRCRQQIHNCIRYMPIINKVHELISGIKKKILGNLSKKEINIRRENLIQEYDKLPQKLKEIYFDKTMQDFIMFYERIKLITGEMLDLLANIITFLNEIDKILITGRERLQRKIFEDLVHYPLCYVVKYLFAQKYYRNFAKQQLEDIQFEFERIRRVIYIEALIASLKQTLKADEKKSIELMQHLTQKPGPFTSQDRQTFDELVQQLQHFNNLPGLGITEHERKAIVSAFNLSKGHWYICPNGHPYIITECGGAMQESQCPDCKERIGGQSHQLLPTNHHFGLMDTSQHAAWSNEANLNLLL